MTSHSDPNRRTYSRRNALAAIGAGTVAALAGCSALGGKSKLQKQLSRVEAATKKYQDPKQALKDGFKIGGPYVPGMGWHFSHPGRLETAAKEGFTLEKPPMLTYVKSDSGLKLGSVEYAAPTGAVSNPDLFADENDEATEKWHTHEAATHVFAVPDGKQTKPSEVSFEQWTTNDHWTEFRPPNKDLAAGDTVALNWGTAHGKEGEKEERVADLVTNHPSLTTLHAWVHAENPEGVFKPVNPKFGGGGHH